MQLQLILLGEVSREVMDALLQSLSELVLQPSSEKLLLPPLGRLLWILSRSTAALLAAARSDMWPLVAPALLALLREAPLVEESVLSPCPLRLTVAETVHALFLRAEAEDGKDPFSSSSSSSRLSLPLASAVAAAVAPLRLCAVLVVEGFPVEAALLHWQTSCPAALRRKVRGSLLFSLPAALRRLHRHLAAAAVGEEEEVEKETQLYDQAIKMTRII